jgi:hypothetical protein
LFCVTTLIPPIAERTITGPEWNSYADRVTREASSFSSACCMFNQKRPLQPVLACFVATCRDAK